MSDTHNTAGAGQAQEPAVNGAVDGAGDGFADNWQSFLQHSWDESPGGEEDEFDEAGTGAGVDTSQATGQQTDSGTSGTDTVQGSNGADTVSSGTGPDTLSAGAGADTVSGQQQDPVIDPADLAAILGLGDGPLAQPGGQQTTQQTQGGQTDQGQQGQQGAGQQGTQDKDEPFLPFNNQFRLQPETLQALFESDDVETRHQALVGLLAGFGNAVVQIMDQRIQEHHAPRVQAATVSSFTERQQAQAVNADFYGKYSELEPYSKVVVRAFEVVSAKHKGKPYTPELRDEVATLAKTALKQMGVQLPNPTQSAAPAGASGQGQQPTGQQRQSAPQRRNPGRTFEAGGARPGGLSDTGVNNGNTPADLVAQLTEF
jgi:hypothetical protein